VNKFILFIVYEKFLGGKKMSMIIFNGSLNDLEGNVLPDYKVVLKHLNNNPLVQNTEIGETITDNQGDFKISYTVDQGTLEKDKSTKILVEIRFLDDKIFETTLTGTLKGRSIELGIIEVKTSNMGVEGRILDEKGKPFEGLVVRAEGAGKTESQIRDSDAIKFLDKLSPVSLKKNYDLGKAKTDKNGFYKIYYHPNDYNNLLNEKPDIWLVIKDSLDIAELSRTEKFPEVSETIKKVDDIQINRNWVDGWYITLNGPEKSRFTSNNQLQIIIDNKVLLENLVNAIKNSKSYVYLTQFEFELNFVATYKSKDSNKFLPEYTMEEVLKDAGRRGVDVKIILNENLAVPDTYKKISQYFKDSNVEVREFKSAGLHVMHAKTMIVDGEQAFIIGSPFKQDYWDTNQHLINDPRREPEHVRPVHDVSVKLEGGSVYYVEEFFTDIWNYTSDEEYHGKGKLKTPNPETTTSGGTSLQIARSITPETLTKKGELGIFEGYRRAFTQAKDFIYLENQFFTNNSVVKALKNLIKARTNLQIIVLLNENPDIPGYKEWQNKAIEKLGIKSIEDNLEHPQIGFFTLWSGGWKEKQFEIQPIYVHTKVAIVDDIWATVGTANLDGSSLTHVNELRGFFDAKFHRNMEINAIIPPAPNNSTDIIKKFRNTLWKEHLGLDDNIMKESDHDWLKIWQKNANQNIKSLNKNKPYLNCQILPYSQQKTSKEQLDDIGLDTVGWNILNSD
jgi:phosphatidylserine/phosphatidylglycerophosphate/cardiolipin synthase-like enzyme